MDKIIVPRMTQTPGESRATQIYGVAGAFLAVAALGLIARLSSKCLIRKALQIDDYLLVWAFTCSVGETASFIWAARYAGLGHHYSKLTPDRIVAFEKVFYADSLVQPCLLASSKISVLLLLRRIFVTKRFRRAAEILMAIVFGWYVAISLAGALICQPIKSSWDPRTPGHCGNRYILNIVDPIPWILTDFAILILPLPMVWKLHTSTRHKVALGGLFLVGALTCIVSCIRYKYAFFSLTDPTWDTVPLLNWNIIEANITIFCACLFASKPVVMFLIPDKLISKTKSYTQSLRHQHSKTAVRNQEQVSDGSINSFPIFAKVPPIELRNPPSDSNGSGPFMKLESNTSSKATDPHSGDDLDADPIRPHDPV